MLQKLRYYMGTLLVGMIMVSGSINATNAYDVSPITMIRLGCAGVAVVAGYMLLPDSWKPKQKSLTEKQFHRIMGFSVLVGLLTYAVSKKPATLIYNKEFSALANLLRPNSNHAMNQ